MRCLVTDTNNALFCSRRYLPAIASELTQLPTLNWTRDISSHHWLLTGSPSPHWPSTNADCNSKLRYDRRSVGQSILVPSPIRDSKPDFFLLSVVGLLMWGVITDERVYLSFAIAAGPRQPNHFRIWAPLDSWSYFTLSNLRLPQHEGPGPHIYTPRKRIAQL
jgi:hypothetical protein